MLRFSTPKFQLSDFWSNTLASTIGTIVGIVLTFGTSYLIERHESANHERDAALMVIHNIDKFCNLLEETVESLEEADSINGLIINYASIDNVEIPDSTLSLFFSHIFHRDFYAHDNTANNIFSNNIEIWQDIADKSFIENVGQCFNAMSLVQKLKDEYNSMSIDAYSSYKRNVEFVQTDGINLKQYVQKVIQNVEVKLLIDRLHYIYLPSFKESLNALRKQNAENKLLMQITDKELDDIFNPNQSLAL